MIISDARMIPLAHRSRSHALGRVSALAIAACGLTLASATHAQVLPVLGPGGGAADGATITTIPAGTGDKLDININNASRVITWTSYNIGATGEVTYRTANAATQYAVLNRVLPGAASVIDGLISSQSNINIWLVNPDGITFNAGGGFNGAGLVLTTLNVANDAAFKLGTSTGLAGTSTALIDLKAGGSFAATKGVVVAGQHINAANSIVATGDVALIAARDVSFPMSLASPLAITVNAGTTFATAKVNADGSINGASVRVVGASEGGAIANLLGVGATGTLTATATGGGVILATKTDATNNVTISSAAAVDGIDQSGALVATTGTGRIAVNATGAVTGTGSYTAPGTINLTGGSVDISNAGLALNSVTATNGAVQLTTTGGDLRVTTVAATGGAATLVSSGSINGRVAGTRTAVSTTGAGNDVSISANGGQAFLGAVTTDAAAAVSVNGSSLDILSTSTRDLSLTAAGSNLVYSSALAFTRDLTLTTTGANDVVFGTINAATAGNATINSGGQVVGDSLTLANGNIAITAATNVRGNGPGRLSLAANGVNSLISASTGATGTATLGTIAAGSGATALGADQVALTAGTLDLTSVIARNGRAALTSTTAVTGNVTIGDSVTANGNATVNSAADIQIAAFDPLAPTTGFIRSTNGNVSVSAAGAVFAIGDTPTMVTDRGFGSVTSGGDITANSAGDLRVNSLSATGFIDLTVGGSLTGRGGTPDITGGALFANGAGGTVSVTATAGPIKLNTVEANATVTTSAPGGIAIGSAKSTTQGVGLTSAAGSYVRALDQANSVVLGTTTPLNLNPAGLTTSAVLEASFGTTSLTAGAGQNITAIVGGNAQLGTIAAGGTVDIAARALTATSATASTGDLILTANVGTLQLGTGSAGAAATITKSGGTLANLGLGDELRVTGLLTATLGDAIIDSNTSARLTQVTATNGNVVVGSTLGDVTGLAGVSTGTSDTAFGRAGLTASAATGDVSVTAAGLAQLGTVSAGRNITVTGGNLAPTNGAVDILSATATNGALTLRARAVAPVVGTIFDGDVILGTGVAGTTAQLSNIATGGTAGDIKISDRLTSGGTATLTGARDVLIKPSDAAVTTGFVRSTGGNVIINTAGSLFGLADNAVMPAQTGYGTVSVTGPTADVTISGTGDARIDSISAGRAISGGVSGSLTGQAVGGIGTNVVGGTLQANGAGGNVTVNAVNTIKLAGASANQTVSLTANGIAVGSAASTAGAVAITPMAAGNFYIGSLTQPGSIALTFNGTLAADPSSVSLTDTLENAFGKTALDAGTSIGLTVGRNAQLGTVTAGTTASLNARAISAISTTANNGALTLTAQSGTLDLGTAVAVGGAGTLTKQLGLATTPGDELRIGSLTASGTATVASGTHVRLGVVSSTAADASVTAFSGDASGLAAASPSNSDPAFGRGDVTAVAGIASVSAARLIQLGTVSSAGLTSLAAGNPTTNGAIDLTNVVATAGSISLSARAVLPTTGVYNGNILLGSATARFNVSMTNLDRGGNSGDIIVANAISAGQDVLIDAARDASLQAVTDLPLGTVGALVVRAGRDASTTDVTVNEDIVVRAGGTANFGALIAGDDIDVRAAGAVTLNSALTTGAGIDSFAASFASPTGLGFVAETTPGANISLVSSGGRVGVAQGLTAPNAIVVSALGGDATIGGDIRSTLLGAVDIDAASFATLSGTDNRTRQGDFSVNAAMLATVTGDVTAGDPSVLPAVASAYTVTGGTGVVLGGASPGAQSATGAISIQATTGDVTQGAGALTLTANSNLTAVPAAESLTVNASSGSVQLGNTDFVGGSVAGRQSIVRLTAAGTPTSDVITGKIDGDQFIVSAARDATFSRAVTAGSLARGADSGVLALGNQTIGVSAGRNVTATTMQTFGAAHDIDVRAGGTSTSTGGLDATGTVVTRAVGNIDYASVRAGEDIAIRSNAGVVTLGNGTATFDVAAGDDIDVQAAGAIVLTSASTSGTGADTRSVNLSGSGVSASYGAQSSTGANIVLTAGTTALISGNVASIGGYAVNAATGVTLGDATARTQSARRGLAVTTAAGDIVAGAGGLVLTSNSDQTGGESLSLTATTGKIDLATSDLVGGSVAGRESSILLASGSSTEIGKADGDRFAVVAGAGFKANGAINAGSLARGGDSAVLTDPQTVDIRATTVDFTSIRAFGTGHDVDIAATGALNGTTLVAQRNTTAVATAIGLDTATATSGNLLLRASGGDAVVGVAGAAGTATVTASQNARATTSLTAGGTATLNAGTLAFTPLVQSTGADVVVSGATVNVGRADAKTALTMTAANGDLKLDQGIAGTTATLATTLLAPATVRGDIVVTTSLLTGGAATIDSVGNVQAALVKAASGDVRVSAFGNVTGIGAGNADLEATLGKLTVTAGPLSAPGALARLGTIRSGTDTVVTGDVASVTQADAGGALTIVARSGDATIGAGGARSVNAALVTANGATATATVGSLTSSTSTATISAGAAANIGSIAGRQATTVTADTVAVSGSATSGTAGVTLTARTSDVSVGALSGVTSSTISAGRDALVGTAATSGGNLMVTAARNVTGLTGGGATLSAAGAGATLGVTATNGLARLGVLGSAAAMTVRAKVSIDLASATSGGDVVLETDGKVTTSGALNAAGRTVTLTASDADIGGTLAANRAVLVNRSSNAANALRLGTGATGSGGFELTETEINRISAAEVVLDAGTGAGQVAQDIAVGALALTTTTGSSRFDVLGTRRIDITGAVTADGSAATRVVRFGGDAGAQLASTIAVAAEADGGGGRIVMPTANLDLRGVRIGVGQKAGFLDLVGLTTGTPLSPGAVAQQFIGQPNSSLYNASIGGLPYTPTAQTTIAARTLNVRVAEYGLFQNTAGTGLTGGAVLGGTTGAPVTGALVVSGLNPPDAGGFALFGSINGVDKSATALLGPVVIEVVAIDRNNTRINGCIVGSGGGGCLVNVLNQPILTVFDNSRANVFKTAADFQIPFDPVVATNNESLFGDVGSFGLADIPVSPSPACSDPKDCPTTQEPKK